MGRIDIPRGRGRAELFTRSGKMRVGEFTGDVRTEASSGDIKLDRIAGELSGDVSSGDIKVGNMRGPINLRASSGDIKISDLVVRERSNRVRVSSGDIRLGISNKNVRVKAEVSSGDIDYSKDFNVTRESKPERGGGLTVIQSGTSIVSIGGNGGGGTVEGYYGNEDELTNAPELSLKASSGDIDFGHTRRSVNEVVAPESTEVAYAECAYCGQSYKSDEVRVSGGKIAELIRPKCDCCGGSEPVLHRE